MLGKFNSEISNCDINDYRFRRSHEISTFPKDKPKTLDINSLRADHRIHHSKLKYAPRSASHHQMHRSIASPTMMYIPQKLHNPDISFSEEHLAYSGTQ